jgi:O-antigen/teichoic acid export membrane protein
MTDFKKHLTFKILTNLVKVPVNLILNALFPRLLGPVNYGNFDFLHDSANKVIGFFDTGSSIAFYTKLSQNHNDRLLIKFYWWVVAILTCAYLLFVVGSGALGYTSSLWPNQTFYFVLLSAILGILTFFPNIVILIMDASNLTVRSEKVRIAQLIFSFLTYGFIFLFLKKIELSYFFYLQCSLIIFLIAGCWLVLRQTKMSVFSSEKLTKPDIRKFGNYFWKFSNPLLVYSIVGLIVGVGARWILQQYGGSIQQAYFGLASKIGSFILLFTTALMPLLIREFSKLFGMDDFQVLSRLFVSSFKGLYILSLFISVLVFF